MITVHILVLIVPVAALLVCIIALSGSRGDLKEKVRWKEADLKDARESTREVQQDLDAARKREGMVRDERAFWRNKAIGLGYPAAENE